MRDRTSPTEAELGPIRWSFRDPRWLVAVFGVVLAAMVVAELAGSKGNIVVRPLAFAGMVLITLMTARRRLDVREGGLVVADGFRRYVVPWADVTEIRSTPVGVVVLRRNGRPVSISPGVLRRSEPLADRLRHERTAAG